MYDTQHPPAYEPGTVDQQIIENACKWNMSPHAGLERAGYIALHATPDSERSGILLHLGRALNDRGFSALYIDAASRLPSPVPCAIAAVLHREQSQGLVVGLFQRIRKFWECSWSSRLLKLFVILAISTIWLAISFANDPIFFRPPYLKSFFANYLFHNVVVRFLSFFGPATIIQILLAFLAPTENSFTKVDEEKFSKPEGYISALLKLHRGNPIAFLIDHAAQLTRFPEIKLIESLLTLDDRQEGASVRALLPDNFRILIIMLNPPEGIALHGKIHSRFNIPDASEELRAKRQEFEQWVRHQIDVFVSDRVNSQKPGFIGTYEWMAYEAELGRPISKSERRDLYLRILRSNLLPIIGLKGKQPKHCPRTVFSNLRADVYPIYARLTCEFFDKHLPQVLARSRVLLIEGALGAMRPSDHWREWEESTHRLVEQAASHAEDLAFSDGRACKLTEILVGEAATREALLIEIIRLLVTAAEIKKAKGQLQIASDLLHAAAEWHQDVQKTIDESLVNRLFLELWTCFWLSCDKEQRDWLFEFESQHAAIQTLNTWNVLKNYELRLQCGALLKDVIDPGPAWPELGNIYQYTMLKDRLITRYADDRNQAAKDGTFDFGSYYPERYPTFLGTRLSLVRAFLQSKRLNDAEPAREVGRQIAVYFDSTCLVWSGDLTWISGQRSVQNSLLYWATSTPDLEGLERQRTELIAKERETRNLASIMGFRFTALDSLVDLGVLYVASAKEQLSIDTLRPWPEAERHFQEVLDIEKDLDWHLNSVGIYNWRCSHTLARANEDAVVDDYAAWYFEAKRAGFPLDYRNRVLDCALISVQSHGSSEMHRRYSARLHEEAANMVTTGERDKASWRKPHAEEEIVSSLYYAVWARARIGDVQAALGLVNKAEAMARQAESLRPGSDGVREAWGFVWLARSAVAHAKNDLHSFRSWLAKCWGSMHPEDDQASYVFSLAIEDGASQSALSRICTLQEANEFHSEKLNGRFLPSQEVKSTLPETLTHFEWYILQISWNSAQLKASNLSNYFSVTRTLGRIAQAIPCQPQSLDLLVRMLESAEAYYAVDSPSNRSQRECLSLLAKLDPTRAHQIQEKLNLISEEDNLLREREEAIERTIQTSGLGIELHGFDDDLLTVMLGERRQHYVDACRTVLSHMEEMLNSSSVPEAAIKLERHARNCKPAFICWSRLRITHLWVDTLRHAEANAQALIGAEQVLDLQARQFLQALLPATVKDQARFEKCRSELYARLEEVRQTSKLNDSAAAINQSTFARGAS